MPLNFTLQKWWESCFEISFPLMRNREMNSFYLPETCSVFSSCEDSSINLPVTVDTGLIYNDHYVRICVHSV